MKKIILLFYCMPLWGMHGLPIDYLYFHLINRLNQLQSCNLEKNDQQKIVSLFMWLSHANQEWWCQKPHGIKAGITEETYNQIHKKLGVLEERYKPYQSQLSIRLQEINYFVAPPKND